MKRSKILSKTEKNKESKIEELINVRPINEATKKDVAGVNYFVKKNLMSVDEVVQQAIATKNPTIMWMVSRFVEGIKENHRALLKVAIDNSSEELLYRQTKKKEVIAGPKLSVAELKLRSEKEKIEAIIKKKANMRLEELIQFSPVMMHASKRNVRAINYLISRGFKTVDEVVLEAIDSNNPLVMYYVALFVNGITDYHVGMIASGMNRCKEYVSEEESNIIKDYRKSVIMQNLARKRPETTDTLAKGVVISSDVYGMVSFSNIENAPVSYLASHILEKADKQDDATAIYCFVRDHFDELDEDYIEKAAKKVMALKNPSIICTFPDFGGASILDFSQALIQAVNNRTEDAVYLYIFCSNYGTWEDFPESEIIEALMRTKNYQYIFRSARDLMLGSYSMELLINKLFIQAKKNNTKCKDFLVNLAITNCLASSIAVQKIIELGDPIIITYVLQNLENEELKKQLQETLDALSFEGESLNDNGVMEMPLVRKKCEEGKLVLVES